MAGAAALRRLQGAVDPDRAHHRAGLDPDAGSFDQRQAHAPRLAADSRHSAGQPASSLHRAGLGGDVQRPLEVIDDGGAGLRLGVYRPPNPLHPDTSGLGLHPELHLRVDPHSQCRLPAPRPGPDPDRSAPEDPALALEGLALDDQRVALLAGVVLTLRDRPQHRRVADDDRLAQSVGHPDLTDSHARRDGGGRHRGVAARGGRNGRIAQARGRGVGRGRATGRLIEQHRRLLGGQLALCNLS